jgi:hypothetical protein
VLFIN